VAAQSGAALLRLEVPAGQALEVQPLIEADDSANCAKEDAFCIACVALSDA
jgi:hypothetical protein